MRPDADWLAPGWAATGVGALMTTRAGGVSVGPFASMNLQSGGGDDDAAVGRNRARLAEAIGAAPVFLRQVHGHRVVRVGRADSAPESPIQAADAVVTTEPGVACTVLVADCLPVLFAAPGGRAVGAAHAGWRGLAGGVLDATVKALCAAAECRPEDLRAWLGASIGPERFQVGSDVLEAFGAASASAPSGRFVPQQEGKWLADLPGLAHDRLSALGLTAIAGAGGCTVSEPSRFFSYRRDRVTGRMGAAVWIER